MREILRREIELSPIDSDVLEGALRVAGPFLGDVLKKGPWWKRAWHAIKLIAAIEDLFRGDDEDG